MFARGKEYVFETMNNSDPPHCIAGRNGLMSIVHLTVLTADNYFFVSPFPRAPARVVVRQDNIII